MSRHYAVTVHIETPGEDDSEETAVEEFAASLRELAAEVSGFTPTGAPRVPVKVTIGTVERA